MANITIKNWIYEDIQGKAFCNNKTIVWNKHYDFDKNGNEVPVFTIKVNSKVRETEKAICFDCVYWWLGSGLRNSINFTEYTGHKVWIPKSAILEIQGV